jgi:hypothetical protein
VCVCARSRAHTRTDFIIIFIASIFFCFFVILIIEQVEQDQGRAVASSELHEVCPRSLFFLVQKNSIKSKKKSRRRPGACHSEWRAVQDEPA